MLESWILLQASMSTLHMKLLVRDYTLDRAQARGPTPVDPTGFVYFARQAPDADSKPDMNPRARSRSTQNTHSNLQVRMTSQLLSTFASLTCCQTLDALARVIMKHLLCLCRLA